MDINARIAQELDIAARQVARTVELFDDGNTVPFIARYRKEVTGELDEVQIRGIQERLAYLRALEAESHSEVRSSNEHDDAYYENQKKMVELLKTERPTTYKFYTKLTPRNKAKVFQQYSADDADMEGRLSHLQKHIMDLYLSK